MIPIKFDFTAEKITLDHLLTMIESEINSLRVNQNKITRIPDGEDASIEIMDDLYEDEIENLFGLCFLVAQNFITSAEGICKKVYAQGLLEKYPIRFDIFNYCAPDGLSKTICNLDSVANYYKHHDQWEGDWSKSDNENSEKEKKGPNQETRITLTQKAVSKLGMSPNNRQNLQTAYQSIFTKEFSIKPIYNCLSDWADCVLHYLYK